MINGGNWDHKANNFNTGRGGGTKMLNYFINIYILSYFPQMREVLKIEPRPLKETICDMGYSLIEGGKVAKSKKYKGKTSS